MTKKIRHFWYLSEAKVTALASGSFPWAERFSARINLGVEGAGIEAELSPQLPGGRSRNDVRRKLDRLEKTLRRNGSVVDVEALKGRAATFFRYTGPSVALIEREPPAAFYDGDPWGNAFFLASVVGRTAVLLAGWAGHAFGANVEPGHVISPSANPIQSMIDLAEQERAADGYGLADSDLWYAWEMVMHRGLGRSDPLVWPVTMGIALYAGQSPPDPHPIEPSSYPGPVDSLVVGSPIYVEQVDPE